MDEGGKMKDEAAPVVFNKLQDWTTRPEPVIKYYSGIATYRKVFDFVPGVRSQKLEVSKTSADHSRLYLDLGVVHDMARVRLNGKDLGVVWCAPWRIEVTSAIMAGANQLEIEVVNRWVNRLIGDKHPGDAGVRTVDCPPGFLEERPFKTGRYTFTTHDPYKADSPLLPSGLLGPVSLMEDDNH
jgi:hypothetical protein